MLMEILFDTGIDVGLLLQEMTTTCWNNGSPH